MKNQNTDDIKLKPGETITDETLDELTGGKGDDENDIRGKNFCSEKSAGNVTGGFGGENQCVPAVHIQMGNGYQYSGIG